MSVYRKPTCTNLAIPSTHTIWLNHPPQYKMAAFHALFNEMYKIPLNA